MPVRNCQRWPRRALVGAGLRSRGLGAAVLAGPGVRGAERARQALVIPAVRRGDDRDRAGGAATSAHGLGHRSDEDELDLVGLEPGEHGDRLACQVLVALGRFGGAHLDLRMMSFTQHARAFRRWGTESFSFGPGVLQVTSAAG